MDLTYLSIISFILITVFYYAMPSIGKLSVSLKVLSAVEEMEIFKRESNIRLAIYLAVVLLTQYIINTTFVINACGGSSISNYGNAFLITFLPWMFIFGTMLVALIMYPGFKGAFSDIVGYFFVSDKANNLLSQILMSDTVAQSAINEITDTAAKSEITRAAESIVKLVGNKAILINQITPTNFSNTWDTLKQLMKPSMYENEQLKSDLLDVAVMRENIGEALWYIYTGILIISYTSYKITSASCPPDMNKVVKKKINVVEEQTKNTANTVVNTSRNVASKASRNAKNASRNAASNAENTSQNVASNVVNTSQNVASTVSNVPRNVASNAERV